MAEPLCRTVRVRCPIAHAFRIFTARIDLWWPQGHRRFAGSRLHLETFPGGRFFERSAAGEEARLGDLLSCEPPHRISLTMERIHSRHRQPDGSDRDPVGDPGHLAVMILGVSTEP